MAIEIQNEIFRDKLGKNPYTIMYFKALSGELLLLYYL